MDFQPPRRALICQGETGRGLGDDVRWKFLAVALLSILDAGECQADKRVALVVGNSRYQNVAPLNNPGHDATLIAETLRGAGFQLIGNGARLDLDKPTF